jgi:phosphoglycolate phosphatase
MHSNFENSDASNSPTDAELQASLSETPHPEPSSTALLDEPVAVESAVAVEEKPGKEDAKKIRYRAKPKFPLPVPAKVLLIDLDGTLVDSATDIAIAANKMREAFGFGPLDPAVIRNYIGRGIPHLVSQTMKSAVGELGASSVKVAVSQFEKQYEIFLTATTKPYPGVFEGLELFKEKGFKLVCVTNKAERFALPILETLGLARYFEMVIAGDSLPEKKPHPLPLQHAAKHFQVKIDEVVMIGDSMHDAAAAREAGCPVFIVSYGYNEGQELRGLDCDAFIDDLPSALKYAKIAS